jgi:hypothetical protein
MLEDLGIFNCGVQFVQIAAAGTVISDLELGWSSRAAAWVGLVTCTAHFHFLPFLLNPIFSINIYCL